ncbi:MAG: hypothetical protein FWH27_17685 [Planctomycetaceae bacterium]|nr:hypothetical protein [Planctomycetaceae bacterium]
MITRRMAPAFLLLFLALGTGCGGNNQKLIGTVTFSDDGSPLKTGTVVLESNNRCGRGVIDTNGNFVMGFESEKDGIPKGETYKVTIVNALEETGRDKSGMPILTPLINPKYGNPNTSGLTFTADGTTKTLDLKVDR